MKREILQSTKKGWWTTKNTCSGFSLVEVILSGSLFALLVTALIGMYLYGQESTALAGARSRAVMLASEGLEATRNMRDANFANITDGVHGLAISSNQWMFSGTSDTTENFTREIIVSSIDPDRKSVTSNVTWQQNSSRAGEVSMVTYLTNWAKVALGDWANPFEQSTLNITGNQNGLKIQTEGNYAYMVTAGGSPDFLVIDVSNPSAPGIVGSLSLAGTPTNIFVTSGYAYVTNNSNNQELQIIDVSNPASPSVVGTYNDAGNEDGLGVYVVGNYAYLVLNGGNDFVVVNVTNKASPSVVDTLVLGGAPYEVVVSGNYAYVASDSDTQEIQVVNISNPASISLAGSLNLPGGVDATTISVYGTNLFIGQGTNFRVVSIVNPIILNLTGTLVFTDDITDVALNTGNSGAYVYLSTRINNGEFQVVDVSNLSAPSVYGLYDVTGNDDMLGLAYSSMVDRVFGASSSNALEFIIFAPQ